MKRLLCCLLPALALTLTTPTRAHAADPIQNDDTGLLTAGVGTLFVVDALLLAGGTVTLFGTAHSLADDHPSEAWRDASIGFGALSLVGAGLFMGLALDFGWDQTGVALAGLEMGLGALNLALAAVSWSISPEVTIVPVAGLDANHQPFLGAGLKLAQF